MPLAAKHRTESQPAISACDPLLHIEETEQRLTFSINGSSTVFDAEPLRQVINVKIAGAGAVPEVLFDLTRMIPLYNISGRVFDIALKASESRRAGGLSTLMKMPIDLYENLRRTDNLPEARDSVQLEGLLIEFSGPSALLAPAAIAAGDQMRLRVEEVLANYIGKVRALEGETVFVSLFPVGDDSEEITCEFRKRQFSGDAISTGQTFRYRVLSSESGETRAKITPFQNISIHPDEIKYLYDEIYSLLPSNEPEGR